MKTKEKKPKPAIAVRRHSHPATTERNKARKAASYARWLAKRQQKAMGQVTQVPGHKRRGSKFTHSEQDRSHSIRLRADGKVIHGLVIEGSKPDGWHNSDREENGCVHFKTPSGKPFTLQFNEFSFLINHKWKTNNSRTETAQAQPSVSAT